ncbi:hypothetical protein BGW41_005585 [Actinomortierella wolfii]|nr:hypothetical protein BGW41_005585 [Actinomortierella wolfii]
MEHSNSLQDIQHLSSYYQRKIRGLLTTFGKSTPPNKGTPIAKSNIRPLMLPEILRNVFSYLPTKVLARANLVCKTWHQLALGLLWRDPFSRPYGESTLIKERILPFIQQNIEFVQSLNLAYVRWDIIEAIALLPVAEFPAVTRLDLHCITLDGGLLAMLLQKTPHLRVLDLKQSNNLNEACIRVIQQLSQLDTLSIDMDIHVWPSKIRRLKWRDDRLGNLDEVIVTLQGILTCCPPLDELILQDVRVDDPSWLEQLLSAKRNLRRLSLYACTVEGNVLQHLAPTCLQRLTRLDITTCGNITATDVLSVLEACPNITSVFLFKVRGLELDKVPQVLGRLQVLSLSQLDISEVSMHAVLDGCHSLRMLCLNNISMGMKALDQRKPWAFADTLQELSIHWLRRDAQPADHRQFSRALFNNLSQLTHLKSLTLAHSDIFFKMKEGLRCLSKLQRLQQLAVYDLSTQLGFEEIQWIVSTYPSLEELMCSEVTNIPFRSWLAQHYPELTLSYPIGNSRWIQMKSPLSFEG